MEHAKILRINELYKKQKSEGLTEAEKAEQAALRKEYLDDFRKGLTAMLDGVVLKRPDGTLEPLKRRDEVQ